MTGVQRALIVATDHYNDSKLTRLNAPASDARVPADVRRDEAATRQGRMAGAGMRIPRTEWRQVFRVTPEARSW
jgi:hypothetical protein